MISNENLSNDQLAEIAANEIARGSERIDGLVDQMTSSELKVLVKTLLHVPVGHQIRGIKTPEISETAKRVLDIGVPYTESVYGLMSIQQELQQETSDNEEETNDSEGEENE